MTEHERAIYILSMIEMLETGSQDCLAALEYVACDTIGANKDAVEDTILFIKNMDKVMASARYLALQITGKRPLNPSPL